MKQQLQRQIGPLKLWQWLLVAILGIGLGILIRRNLGVKPTNVPVVGNPEFGQSTAGPDGLSPTQGSLPLQGQQQDFSFQQVVYEFMDRFDDEIDALQTGQEDLFTEVKKRTTVVNQPAPIPQPAPTPAPAPSTTATETYWQRLVKIGAIKGNPSYYDTGQATQAEFEHALAVADAALRRDTGERQTFWQRLVDRGHIAGDPTYYSQGRASQAEFEHAYDVAAASIARKGGAF